MNKSNMVPQSQLLIPVLKALKELGGSANIGELDAKVIDMLEIPDDIQNILHNENGSRTEIEYRLAWARTRLKNHGVIENPSYKIWSFTENFDSSVDLNDLSTHGKNAWITPQLKSLADIEENIKAADNEEIPEEKLDWHEHLRAVLLKMHPDAFERLTLRLLRESGFTQVEVTGKSKDRGIDGKGIIRLHDVMSFHMVFQCKRYKGSVSSNEIRDFRGAMQGRAEKGLFITTGSFTSEAKKEATRDGAPAIDLIDGDNLIERLKDLGLGVTEKIVKDYDVNEEWFMKI